MGALKSTCACNGRNEETKSQLETGNKVTYTYDNNTNEYTTTGAFFNAKSGNFSEGPKLDEEEEIHRNTNGIRVEPVIKNEGPQVMSTKVDNSVNSGKKEIN